MPEHSENVAENIVSGVMDAIADKLPKQKSVRFTDESSISSQAKKLFGGDKSVHHILGGGKCMNLLLGNWELTNLSSIDLVWWLIALISCHNDHCSRRRVAVEEQENIIKCSCWCNSCLGVLRVAWLSFPDYYIICAYSWHGFSVWMVKLRRHAQRV